ncbi:uncharacterized protein LOC106665530 [Cimex lectularius]|uniref:BHLH domain-containing protein n=1 Tax=Cimex lectularius TaxID=79782 RepID=A0A8I6SU66_CIMLE|nr:uncharacterized protein LOC106665530 [Cimex lectularius]
MGDTYEGKVFGHKSKMPNLGYVAKEAEGGRPSRLLKNIHTIRTHFSTVSVLSGTFCFVYFNLPLRTIDRKQGRESAGFYLSKTREIASLGREEKIRIEDIHQYEEDISSYCSLSGEGSESPVSARVHHNGSSAAGAGMEQEKRIRREIANSNERRRMQSINAGFQSLRTLLPHHEGEKLSKAAILNCGVHIPTRTRKDKTSVAVLPPQETT